MMKCAVIVLAILGLTHATDYSLRVNKMRFDKCPNGPGGTLINTGRSRVNVAQTSTAGGANLKDFSYKGPDGSREKLSFPGCFSIQAQATFGATVHNPYIEVGVSFNGMKVCDRYYKPNKFCRPTHNQKYKSEGRAGTSCRFCNLCIEARKYGGQAVSTIQSAVGSSAVNRVCNLAKSGIKAGQTFPLNLPNICVPDPDELEKLLDRKIPNWRQVRDLAKRGSIVVTLHVFDRANPPPDHCLARGGGAGCAQYLNDKSVGKKDKYIACYFGNIDYTLDWN